MRLAGKTGRKNDAKNCHLGTTAQLCWGNKWLRSVREFWGHPCKFQRVSRLGSVNRRVHGVTVSVLRRRRRTGSKESPAAVAACREVVVMAVGAVELVVLARERMVDERHLTVAALETALVPMTLLVR